MGLRAKFHLQLFVLGLSGFAACALAAYGAFQDVARQQAMHDASLMMDTALSIRGYTVNQVKPHLEMQLMRVFVPQSVPAYAATETLNALGKKYRGYAYKEAALNPTNPKDKAAEWEAGLIQDFKGQPELKEVSGQRETPAGVALYLARPLQVTAEACLACHSTADAAPKTMVALYGDTNGFGWKLNDIVGVQVMSVPLAIVQSGANRAFYRLLPVLAGVFALVMAAVAFAMQRFALGRLSRLALLAEQAESVSRGKTDIPEFPATGGDDIARVEEAFNRMRRGLQKAMRMLEP